MTEPEQTADNDNDDLYERLTGDDILTSFEFVFNNFRSSDPSAEKSLMMSVLVYGLIDFLSTNRKIYFEDARSWFFDTPSDEEDWLYSFENVAYVMHFNARQFRDRLLELKQKQIHFAIDGKTIKSMGNLGYDGGE